MHRLRVQRALTTLTFDWQEFADLPGGPTAVDSKQLAGTLVALRNRGVVETLVVHGASSSCITYWRLSELPKALQLLRTTQDAVAWYQETHVSHSSKLFRQI